VRIPPPEALAAAAGRAVAPLFALGARLRRGRPIHTRGFTLRGELLVTGAHPPAGVPLLDAPAAHPALVRLSRAAGLPAPLPDILGIAVRVRPDTDPVDLLLSTTGMRPLGRRLLVPRRHLTRPHGTLLAYRTPPGPLLLSLVPDDGRTVAADPAAVLRALEAGPLRMALRCASPGGPWRRVGTLRLDAQAPAGEERTRFDPVRHAAPGLAPARVWAALREPPYVAARRAWPGPGDRPGAARPGLRPPRAPR
jgi:hypothetical protein